MSTEMLLICARAAHDAIIAREAEIEGLDRAIGDGDHYHNVKRGTEAVVTLCEQKAEEPPDALLKAVGMKMLSTIGGASGPLMASFFLAAARTEGIDRSWTTATVARLVRDGVEAIKARGKADVGCKTMLDTLVPVAEALELAAETGDNPAATRRRVRSAADEGMRSTAPMRAKFGRAAFLGERAIGHVDPGAMSCFVMTMAVCDALEAHA